MNIFKALVGGVSLGMDGDRVTQELHGFLKGVRVFVSPFRHNRLHVTRVGLEMFTQVDSLEGQRTAGVFFFGETENVGTQTNLRLGLLFAVACIRKLQ